jgi:hypothetical protein
MTHVRIGLEYSAAPPNEATPLFACFDHALLIQQRRMTPASNGGSFKISDAPMASSPIAPEESGDATQLGAQYGQPFVFAMAMNPHTLFVYWSVDWPAAFGSDLPPDRKAHIKLKCGDSERTHPVEPLAGSCSIGDLESGQTYAFELGYYAPADKWNVITSGYELMMPLLGDANDERSVEVATVPFHLAFQKLIDLFGAESGPRVVQALARFEAEAGEKLIGGASIEKLMRALGLSGDDLAAAVATRGELAKIKTRTSSASAGFSRSSWSGSGS